MQRVIQLPKQTFLSSASRSNCMRSCSNGNGHCRDGIQNSLALEKYSNYYYDIFCIFLYEKRAKYLENVLIWTYLMEIFLRFFGEKDAEKILKIIGILFQYFSIFRCWQVSFFASSVWKTDPANCAAESLLASIFHLLSLPA